MADHDDPMCPAARSRKNYCYCELIRRIRADERERIVAELDGPAQESEAMYAHAEAVAARLVEVICDDEDSRQDALSVAVWQALKDGDGIARNWMRRQVEALRVRYRAAGPAGTPTQAGYDAGADDALSDVLDLLDGGGSDGA